MQFIDLSLAQARVLAVYRTVIEKEKRPPTFKEAANLLKVSKMAVVKTVNRLEKRRATCSAAPGVGNVVLTDKARF